MSKRFPMNEQEAALVKQKIWDGEMQKDIAREHNISQTQVSRIKLGDSWNWIPWPDGTTGPLPALQERQQMVREYRPDSTPEEIVPLPALPENTSVPQTGPAPLSLDARAAQDQAIRRLRDEILEEEEQKEREDLSPKRPRREKARRKVKSQEEPPPLKTWEECLFEDAEHPLVKEAISTDNKALKRAIQETFSSVSPSIWREAATCQTVRELADRMTMEGQDDV